MLSCQFCGFDYSEQGLQEGHCPSCGVLLAWQDEADTADNKVSDSELPLPQPLTPADDDSPISFASPSFGHSPAPAGASQPPEQPDERPAAFGPTAPQDPLSTPPVNESPAPAPASEVNKSSSAAAAGNSQQRPQRGHSESVEKIWSKSITDRPESTIQTPSNYGTVSNLVIRQRALSQGATLSAPAADYELLNIIGEGGVGIVYAARQASINRTVAVKMLRSETNVEEEQGKFLAEAVVTGELDHPNIVPIYDLGSNQEGALFYSMKQVQGTPWSKAILEKTLAENLEILMKVGDAIAFAHARGVVHRDLKPENVMLGEFGEVLVMDWGLALSTSILVEHDEDQPMAGMGGTPAYMSPEMAAGPITKIGPASDVYLLGAILYECITGLPPHHGKTVMDCISNAWLNVILPTKFTGELVDIALRAMNTQPEDRYASVKDLQQAIREYESHLESIALVQRGDQALEQAEATQDYKEYSRSIVAFEEAISLWSSNEDATKGLEEAVTAYATTSLRKGDFELGLSLLDEADPKHKSLIGKLKRALAERDARQQRISSLRRTAALLVLTMLGVASVAGVFCFVQWQEALNATQVAEQAQDDLNDSLEEEEQQRLLAEAAKVDANKARGEAEDNLTKAEVSSANEAESLYNFEIQLANERIHDNSFQSAERLLDDQLNAIQRKFRHWEWGRLRYLCELSEATLTKADNDDAAPVLSVAAAPNGQLLAVGFADGQTLIWRNPGRPWGEVAMTAPMILNSNGPVTALAISRDGTLLAVGVDAKNQSDVTLYRIGIDESEPQVAHILSGHKGAINSLKFSRDDKRILSGSADETARLWIPFSNDSPKVFYGHFGSVRNAEFSHDEKLLVTASDDGSARIWNPRTGAEVASFRAHDGPIHSAIFLPGDKHVATGGADGRILIWSPTFDGNVLNAVNEAKAKSLFADAEVNRVRDILAGEADGAADQYVALGGHHGQVRTLTLAANGALLISGGNDSTLRVWEPSRVQDGVAPTDLTDAASKLRNALLARASDEDLSKGLLATLRGHGSWISSCVVVDNELKILSGSYDQSAKIWQLADYQEVETYEFDRRAIVSAAQSQDSEWMAAALDDGTARVWRKSGDVIHLPPLTEGHSFLTSNAIISPEDNRLYTAAGDNTVRIWDFGSGGERKTLSHTGREGVLAVSPNGKWLVTGSDAKSALIWESDRRVGELDHASFVAAKLSQVYPDVDIEELKSRAKNITAASISPDNDTVFTGDGEGGGWLWSIKNSLQDDGAPPRQMRLHSGRINAAVFVGQEKLITASSDNTVALWNLGAAAQDSVVRLRHNAPVTALSVSVADEETLIATATVFRTQLKRDEWKTVSQAHLSRLGEPSPSRSVRLRLTDGRDVERVNSIELAADRQSAIIACSVGSDDHLLRWTFAADGQKERVEPLWRSNIFRGSISAAILTREKDILTVGGRGAVLWTSAGRKKRSFRPHSTVNSIRFSHDAKFVVTTGSDGIGKVWSILSDPPQVVAKLELPPDVEGEIGGHSEAVLYAEFHPLRSNVVLTTSADRTARIWSFDASTGKSMVVSVLGGEQGHTGAVQHASFSHRGDNVVTVSDDGSARVWKVSEPSRPTAVLQHKAAVLSCRFSANDEWIATGATDNLARIWHVESQRLLGQVVGHSSAVTAVDFSADGQRLLTGSRDNTALLWDITQLWQTSRLDQQSGDQKPQRITREILALEHHQGEVTVADFSKDGRTVITSSLDGALALCHTQAVGASLLLTVGPPVPCRDKPVRIDEAALIRRPNVESFLDHTLVAELDGEAQTTEEVFLNADWDNQIQIEDGSVFIVVDGKRQIGSIEGADKPTSVVKIKFSAIATAPDIEKLIRCLAYRNSAIEAEQTRAIRIRLLDAKGRSGNYENETRRNVRKIRLIAPPPPAETTAS